MVLTKINFISNYFQIEKGELSIKRKSFEHKILLQH